MPMPPPPHALLHLVHLFWLAAGSAPRCAQGCPSASWPACHGHGRSPTGRSLIIDRAAAAPSRCPSARSHAPPPMPMRTSWRACSEKTETNKPRAGENKKKTVNSQSTERTLKTTENKPERTPTSDRQVRTEPDRENREQRGVAAQRTE